MAPASLPGDRPNIRDTLVDELRAWIVDGRLPAGERVNEVQLAARLRVSRTPLREALGALVAEGALRSSPRIGYFVTPLTADEFRQLYAVRALLDPEALRLAGLPSSERLSRLEARNAQVRAATSAARAIALDDAWHMELVAGCPNPILVELIEQFMRRTRRYEIAFMRDRRNVRGAALQHARILAALRRGRLDAACEALRENLESGIAPVVAWLESRAPRSDTERDHP